MFLDLFLTDYLRFSNEAVLASKISKLMRRRAERLGKRPRAGHAGRRRRFIHGRSSVAMQHAFYAEMIRRLGPWRSFRSVAFATLEGRTGFIYAARRNPPEVFRRRMGSARALLWQSEGIWWIARGFRCCGGLARAVAMAWGLACRSGGLATAVPVGPAAPGATGDVPALPGGAEHLRVRVIVA